MSDNLAEYLRWSIRLLNAVSDDDGMDGYLQCQQNVMRKMTQEEYNQAQKILDIIDEELA